jgi:beta-mannosidase
VYKRQLQAVGLNFIFEEARRHKPYCSMAMNWCFNDCWPAASNTSIICYPNKPKEAFFSVKNACRPVLASARVKKILWNTGELFEADLFILNDSMQGISEGILSVNLLIDDTKLNITEWDYPSADPLKNITGPKVSFEIPEIVNPQFYLLIEDRKNPEYNSKYLLLKNYE